MVDALSRLNDMRVSYILSYYGKTGGKEHGKPLPHAIAAIARGARSPYKGLQG